jgi:hypothetical protein
MATMPAQTLKEFLARYDPDGTRTVADITPVRDKDGSSPFVIVRHGRFAAVLSLIPFDGDGAHLCIDVHPFADGRDATAGVFGMSRGYRSTLQPSLGTTSHGWASAHLVAVLIGEQGTTGDTTAS